MMESYAAAVHADSSRPDVTANSLMYNQSGMQVPSGQQLTTLVNALYLDTTHVSMMAPA